jgi:hypothetical protein
MAAFSKTVGITSKRPLAPGANPNQSRLAANAHRGRRRPTPDRSPSPDPSRHTLPQVPNPHRRPRLQGRVRAIPNHHLASRRHPSRRQPPPPRPPPKPPPWKPAPPKPPRAEAPVGSNAINAVATRAITIFLSIATSTLIVPQPENAPRYLWLRGLWLRAIFLYEGPLRTRRPGGPRFLR